MRRKKFGIEPPSAYCNDETNYTSVVEGSRHLEDESRETPNFSLAITKREYNAGVDSSPDKVEEPPVPMQHRYLEVPHSM